MRRRWIVPFLLALATLHTGSCGEHDPLNTETASAGRSKPAITAVTRVHMASFRSWTFDIWPDGAAELAWRGYSEATDSNVDLRQSAVVDPAAITEIAERAAACGLLVGDPSVGLDIDDGSTRWLVIRTEHLSGVIWIGDLAPYDIVASANPEGALRARSALEVWRMVERLLPPTDMRPALLSPAFDNWLEPR